MQQDSLFALGEGDRWFARNRAALRNFDPGADLPLRLLELYGLGPRSVLEIGAADGFRLAEIRARTGARGVAVEPSARAAAEGRARFPDIEFVRGIAHAVPLRGAFDLVIVNFVFHWISRANLLRAIAEVDRLVADGGSLILGDFQPSNRFQIPYHHLPASEVYTFKQDYAASFLASGLYHPVCLLTRGHGARRLQAGVAEDQRIGAWLLHKAEQGHYARPDLGEAHASER
ncbi:MAG TPA: class I SAM-dependent methyltransferase [candidate division Zixibacteria bacterium]|nr:class I SAM-dependent methyltransferase [candidate division Zixibacteria bacterium]